MAAPWDWVHMIVHVLAHGCGLNFKYVVIGGDTCIGLADYHPLTNPRRKLEIVTRRGFIILMASPTGLEPLSLSHQLQIRYSFVHRIPFCMLHFVQLHRNAPPQYYQ